MRIAMTLFFMGSTSTRLYFLRHGLMRSSEMPPLVSRATVYGATKLGLLSLAQWLNVTMQFQEGGPTFQRSKIHTKSHI